MDITDVERLRSIKSFPSLVKYLRDELDWPVESDDFDELTYDYEPAELGIDAKAAVKIKEIKQLRPLTNNQPFGIFFINFDPKRLPVVMLRRILRGLVLKKRTAAAQADKAAWAMNDLLFISSYGETEERTISFAYFKEDEYEESDLPTLRVLGWDGRDTVLHLGHVHQTLKEKLQWPENDADSEAWRERWASAFVTKHREVITTAKALATRLAELARDIRNRVNAVLEVESDRGPLRKLHTAFKQALIHDLSEDDFADMYAQTVAYGLLAARVSRPAGLVADNIVDMVPVSNPFLQELLETFLHLGGRKKKGNAALDFDELGVTEVVEVLRHANMEAVLRDFGDKNPQEDPVIHFYEDFLKAYDKQKRTQRGVFYTPRPVVSFIVRSVHELLQTEFGLEDGLADTATWGDMLQKHPELKLPMLSDDPQETNTISPEEPFVQVLDPATGTATFIVEVIEVIYNTLRDKWLKQGKTLEQVRALWNDYVPKHLLPRIHGYELMMAPYAIAHMKIGLKLQETEYQFKDKERVRVYLTNALEPHQKQLDLPDFDALAHEAAAVNEIKRTKRFTVVVGNPPYSVNSANKKSPIDQHLSDYKMELIDERNLKPLNDDYVKFLRFAQIVISVSRIGLIGMITNHSYTDARLFRSMRFCLMMTFGKIWFLDLRGDRNRDPSMIGDENVFDIQQGVGISLLLHHHTNVSPTCDIHISELRGERQSKYLSLLESTYRSVKWKRISPSLPHFSFGDVSSKLTNEYAAFVPINNIFINGNVGYQTHRDSFVIDMETDVLLTRIHRFKESRASEEDISSEFGIKSNRDWSIKVAHQSLNQDKDFVKSIRKTLYRPFDVRFIFYTSYMIDYDRYDLMQHMRDGNTGLLISKVFDEHEFTSVFVTKWIVESKIADRTRGSYLYPLRLCHSSNALGIGSDDSDKWQSNISGKIITNLAKICKINGASISDAYLTPEHVFHYTYSVFHSPTYRTRYAEFLKIDFPRVPLPGSLELFQCLAKLGGELVSLHLMESPRLKQHITIYKGASAPTVEKVSWSQRTVWVDKAQTCGFQGVPEAVWNFHIGGYQVCNKWLKDRKGRTLSQEDMEHYHRIVVALHETIRIMGEIDKVIEGYGGWPGAFATAPLEPSAPAPTGETDELPFV